MEPRFLTGFTLDPRIKANAVALGEWPLSLVMMMNEARYRWLLLVPRRADVTEIAQLPEADALQLMREIRAASAVLKTFSDTGKINVAALGNQVPQLHVHVIARRPGDPAWPGVVWDKGPALPLEPAALQERLSELTAALSSLAF